MISKATALDGKKIAMNLRDVKGMSKDDVLALLGLETRHSGAGPLLSVLGTFGAGVLVGAGMALLLAPKPGRQLRRDLRGKLGAGKAVTDGVNNAAYDVPSDKG